MRVSAVTVNAYSPREFLAESAKADRTDGRANYAAVLRPSSVAVCDVICCG